MNIETIAIIIVSAVIIALISIYGGDD